MACQLEPDQVVVPLRTATLQEGGRTFGLRLRSHPSDQKSRRTSCTHNASPSPRSMDVRLSAVQKRSSFEHSTDRRMELSQRTTALRRPASMKSRPFGIPGQPGGHLRRFLRSKRCTHARGPYGVQQGRCLRRAFPQEQETASIDRFLISRTTGRLITGCGTDGPIPLTPPSSSSRVPTRFGRAPAKSPDWRTTTTRCCDANAGSRPPRACRVRPRVRSSRPAEHNPPLRIPPCSSVDRIVNQVFRLKISSTVNTYKRAVSLAVPRSSNR
jgi:hypothetical protein